MAFVSPFQTVFRSVFGGGAAAAVPWSLSYDGSDDETDCGNGASLKGLELNAAGFTCDVYWKPAYTGNPMSFGVLASQSDGLNWWDPTGGWYIFFSPGWPLANSSLWFYCTTEKFGSGQVYIQFTPTADWAYVRIRTTGGTGGGNYCISVNAGVEGVKARAVGAGSYKEASPAGFWQMRHGSATHYHGNGNLCYVHVWNTDKGALGAVPTSPFAVDANTVGRWIHSEGAGATLGDTSGNLNNGTISGATWSATVPAGWSI